MVYSTLNGLRGLAALAVASVHGYGFFGAWYFSNAYLAVDLFFLLSGFVLAYAYENKFRAGLSAAEFVRVRIIRFYPLYFLGTLIGGVWATIVWLLGGGDLSGSDLVITAITSIFFLPSPLFVPDIPIFPFNIPAWSLFFELIINIFYAMFWRRFTTKIIFLTLVVSVSVLIVEVLRRDANIGAWWPQFIFGFARVHFSFFTGVLIYRGFRPTPRIDSSLLAWGIGAFVLLTLILPIPQIYQSYYDLLCIILIYPSVIGISALIQARGRSLAVFGWLGLISFPLYSIHQPVFRMITDASRVVRAPDWLLTPLSAWFVLAVLAIVSGFLATRFDQPVRGWLQHKWASVRLRERVRAAT